MVTHSRQSAVSLTVLGLFVFWALVIAPARARLPAISSLPSVAPTIEPTVAPMPSALAAAAPHLAIETITVQPGDSLMSLLQRAGIAPTAAQTAIDALADKWNPRGLKTGQEIAITRDEDGVKELRFAPDLQRNLVLTRGGDGRFTAASLPRHILNVPLHVAGTIRSSLFDAAATAGLPQAVLTEVIHAFSYDVDFQREVQPGDGFDVLFDQLIDEKSGKIVGTGEIAYAALTLSGKVQALYRFTPPGGLTGYYTAQGASVKKALLRTPVDGARISSGFGMREHPILGFTRMHQGVDFAVPSGTPIMASGDAVVASAGWNAGGYGNLVVLRHDGSYSTAYGHMSRIAKGIKPGVHVRQGEVIGYVGMTGLATGPHLHYEVRINNKPVNPLSVHMAPAQKLEGRALADFHTREAAVAKQLASLRGGNALAQD